MLKKYHGVNTTETLGETYKYRLNTRKCENLYLHKNDLQLYRFDNYSHSYHYFF